MALCERNSPVTGEFLSQRPVTWSIDGFFDLRLNKQLSKQLRHWWFEMPSHSLWCHCNGRGIIENVIVFWWVCVFNLIQHDTVWILFFCLKDEFWRCSLFLCGRMISSAYICSYKTVHYINTFRLRQNGCHFADDIFKQISWIKHDVFLFKFHWSLLLTV